LSGSFLCHSLDEVTCCRREVDGVVGGPEYPFEYLGTFVVDVVAEFLAPSENDVHVVTYVVA